MRKEENLERKERGTEERGYRKEEGMGSGLRREDIEERRGNVVWK